MHTIDRRHHCFALVSVSIARGVHYDGINRLFKGRKRFPEIGKITNKKPSSLKCWMKPLTIGEYERSAVFQTGVVGPMLFSIYTTDPSDAFIHLHHSSDCLRWWSLTYPVCHWPGVDREITRNVFAAGASVYVSTWCASLEITSVTLRMIRGRANLQQVA